MRAEAFDVIGKGVDVRVSDDGKTVHAKSDGSVDLRTLFPPAKAAPPADAWGWWAGTSEEYMTIGPHATRESVMAEACSDEIVDPGESFYLCEATQKPQLMSGFIQDGDDLIQYADERFSESDLASENQDVFFDATPEQTADLEKRVKAAVDAWQEANGLVFRPFTFTDVRNESWVVMPAPTE